MSDFCYNLTIEVHCFDVELEHLFYILLSNQVLGRFGK